MTVAATHKPDDQSPDTFRLNLTDSEWVDVCMGASGRALAPCCAEVSNLRRLLCEVLRSGGFISTREDAIEIGNRIVQLAATHGTGPQRDDLHPTLEKIYEQIAARYMR